MTDSVILCVATSLLPFNDIVTFGGHTCQMEGRSLSERHEGVMKALYVNL